jgi:hypothetical protein
MEVRVWTQDLMGFNSIKGILRPRDDGRLKRHHSFDVTPNLTTSVALSPRCVSIFAKFLQTLSIVYKKENKNILNAQAFSQGLIQTFWLGLMVEHQKPIGGRKSPNKKDLQLNRSTIRTKLLSLVSNMNHLT